MAADDVARTLPKARRALRPAHIALLQLIAGNMVDAYFDEIEGPHQSQKDAGSLPVAAGARERGGIRP